MTFNLIFRDDRESKMISGYFEGVQHIVCYGNSIEELTKELFKSMAIIADYKIRSEAGLSTKRSDNEREIEFEI